MDEGRRITDLDEMTGDLRGTSYLAEAGDGSGTRRVTHETLVEAIKSVLPIGNLKDVGTEATDTIANALAEIFAKATSEFTGTDGVKAGTAGIVPAPQPKDEGKVLKSDGKWVTLEEIGALPKDGTVKVVNGGTGANNATDARNNLQITPANIGALPTSGALNSAAAVAANTAKDNFATALALKEIGNNIGFVQKDGILYFRNAWGADTGVPFSGIAGLQVLEFRISPAIFHIPIVLKERGIYKQTRMSSVATQHSVASGDEYLYVIKLSSYQYSYAYDATKNPDITNITTSKGNIQLLGSNKLDDETNKHSSIALYRISGASGAIIDGVAEPSSGTDQIYYIEVY